MPVCVRIRSLHTLPSVPNTKFLAIRSGFAFVFFQFRAMNKNFDVLVLSIYYSITRKAWRRLILDWTSEAIRLMESSTRRSPKPCSLFSVNRRVYV